VVLSLAAVVPLPCVALKFPFEDLVTACAFAAVTEAKRRANVKMCFFMLLLLWLSPGFGYLVLITFGMKTRADGGQRSALQICSIACSLLVAKVVSLIVPLLWDALKVNFSMFSSCCGG